MFRECTVYINSYEKKVYGSVNTSNRNFFAANFVKTCLKSNPDFDDCSREAVQQLFDALGPGKKPLHKPLRCCHFITSMWMEEN